MGGCKKFDQYIYGHKAPSKYLQEAHSQCTKKATTDVIASTKVQLGYYVQKRERNVPGRHSIKGLS